MGMNNIKNEFPAMPDEIRERIHREVDIHISEDTRRKRVGKFIWKNVAAVILMCVVGGTGIVYAGGRLYNMYIKHIDKYQVETIISYNNEASATDEEEKDNVYNFSFTKVDFTYMPENMEVSDNLDTGYFRFRYGGEADLKNPDMEFIFYRLPENEQFEAYNTNVISSENIKIGSNDAVLLELNYLKYEYASIHNIIYVVYDNGLILEALLMDNFDTDEAVKIIDGIVFDETDEKTATEICMDNEKLLTYSYSEKAVEAIEESDALMEVSNSQMANMHNVGDEFTVQYSTMSENELKYEDINVVVKGVDVCDDYSVLNTDAIKYHDMEKYIGDDGKLIPNTRYRVKTGDGGINEIDEPMSSETINEKLVVVTIDYTNTNDKPLKMINTHATLCKFDKTDSGYKIFDIAQYLNYGEGERAEYSDYSNSAYPSYFYTGESVDDKNNIQVLNAGETKTVVWAFFVDEECLPYLYLNVAEDDTYDSFSENVLDIGYIDIRQ